MTENLPSVTRERKRLYRHFRAHFQARTSWMMEILIHPFLKGKRDFGSMKRVPSGSSHTIVDDSRGEGINKNFGPISFGPGLNYRFYVYANGANKGFCVSSSAKIDIMRPSKIVTGQDNDSVRIRRTKGPQHLGRYRLNWNDLEGGTPVITNFNFSPTSPAPRFRLWADPTHSETGRIWGEFLNSRPTVTLTSPGQAEIIENATPFFSIQLQ